MWPSSRIFGGKVAMLCTTAQQTTKLHVECLYMAWLFDIGDRICGNKVAML